MKKLLILLLLLTTPVNAGVLSVEIKDDSNREVARVEDGALNTLAQDPTTRVLDLKFSQGLGAPTTLSSPTVEGEYTINVVSSVNFIAGRLVGIFNGEGNFYFGEVLSVNVNEITLDTPLDRVFDIGENVIIANTHLNVDGSITPQIFQITSGQVLTVDITRIMGNMSNSTSMDDGTFGGLPTLTNGVIFRKVDGETVNYWNVKSNGDLALICFDATYSTRAPGGENGFRFRNSYAGQSKHGAVIRLEPGDTLEVIIQDNISGLTDFQMMAQGHIVLE